MVQWELSGDEGRADWQADGIRAIPSTSANKAFNKFEMSNAPYHETCGANCNIVNIVSGFLETNWGILFELCKSLHTRE